MSILSLHGLFFLSAITHRSCLTLFFCTTLTGTKRTATCCQLLREATFCSSAPPRRAGDEWACRAVTHLSVFASHTLHGDDKAFEQLCAGRSSFFGSPKTPCCKKPHHVYMWYLTGQCLPCLIIFLVLLRASSVADDVTKHNKLWIWAWALVILEDDCDKAQRAPCCCHLLPLFCLPDKSYVYIKSLWLLCWPTHVNIARQQSRHNVFLHQRQRALSHCALCVYMTVYLCRKGARQSRWRLKCRKNMIKTQTQMVSLSIQILQFSFIWVDLWQGHRNPLLSVFWR